MEKKKIVRSSTDLIVAGVCGGLADYFQIDSSLVRIIFILLVICGGSGLWIYLILWLIFPQEKEVKTVDREEKVKEFASDVKDKARSMAKEIKLNTKIKKYKRVNIFGVVLILLGGVIIWNQLAPFAIDWNFFWPGLLILIGVLLLFRQ